ncbi:MAG: hypothetical protein D6744_10995, partial [Planctomycetota bacterium]
TAPVRMRAMVASGLVFAAIPTILFLIPVRWHIHASGLVHAENETVVHALSAGFLKNPNAKVGSRVAEGQLLAELENPQLAEALLEVEARLTAAEIRRDAYRVEDPARAALESRKIPAIEHERERRLNDVESLAVRTPTAGLLVHAPSESDIGQFVDVGEPVAMLASGGWVVRVVLNEDQMLASSPQIGQHATFRPRNNPQQIIEGVIQRIRPLATRTIESLALTQAGGGDIVVDPSHQTVEPYFEVTVLLKPKPDVELQRGATGVVRLDAHPEPIGLLAYRSIVRFLDNLAKG